MDASKFIISTFIALFLLLSLVFIIGSVYASDYERDRFYNTHERKTVNNRDIFVEKDSFIRQPYQSSQRFTYDSTRNYVREVNRWQTATPVVIQYARSSVIEQEYDIDNSGSYRKYHVGYVDDSPDEAYRIAALENKKHVTYSKKYFTRNKMMVFSRYVDENNYELSHYSG